MAGTLPTGGRVGALVPVWPVAHATGQRGANTHWRAAPPPHTTTDMHTTHTTEKTATLLQGNGESMGASRNLYADSGTLARAVLIGESLYYPPSKESTPSGERNGAAAILALPWDYTRQGSARRGAYTRRSNEIAREAARRARRLALAKRLSIALATGELAAIRATPQWVMLPAGRDAICLDMTESEAEASRARAALETGHQGRELASVRAAWAIRATRAAGGACIARAHGRGLSDAVERTLSRHAASDAAIASGERGNVMLARAAMAGQRAKVAIPEAGGDKLAASDRKAARAARRQHRRTDAVESVPRAVVMGARAVAYMRPCDPLRLADSVFIATAKNGATGEYGHSYCTRDFSVAYDNAGYKRGSRLRSISVASGNTRLDDLCVALGTSFVKMLSRESGEHYHATSFGHASGTRVNADELEDVASIYHLHLAKAIAKRPSIRVPSRLSDLFIRRGNRLSFRDLLAIHRAMRHASTEYRSMLWGKGRETAQIVAMDAPMGVDSKRAAYEIAQAWECPIVAGGEQYTHTAPESVECDSGSYRRKVVMLRREVRHARECLAVFHGLSGSRKAIAAHREDEAILCAALTSGSVYADHQSATDAANRREAVTYGLERANTYTGNKGGMSDALRSRLRDLRARLAAGDQLMTDCPEESEALLATRALCRGMRAKRPVATVVALAMSGDWIGAPAEADGSAGQSRPVAHTPAPRGARHGQGTASAPWRTIARGATVASRRACVPLAAGSVL